MHFSTPKEFSSNVQFTNTPDVALLLGSNATMGAKPLHGLARAIAIAMMCPLIVYKTLIMDL